MLLKFDLDVQKVQLYAARIVTGLLIITLRTSLYFETGWEPLVNSRDRSKLSKMYKIYNNLVPSYLKEITPAMTPRPI